MATVAIYQPQLQVPVAQMPALESGSVGGAAAEATGAVLRSYEKKLRRDGAAWAASTIARLRNEYGQRLQDAEHSGTAGPGFAEGTATAFGERVETLRKEMPPYATGLFETGVADVFKDIDQTARAIEDEARLRQSETEIETSLDNLTAVAARDPGETPSVRDEADAIVRAFAPRPGLRQQLEAKVRNVAVAGLTELGRRDPMRLLALFESGEAKGLIPDPVTYRALHQRARTDVRRGAVAAVASALALSTRKVLDGRAEDERIARAARDADELEAVASQLNAGASLDPADARSRRGANALYRDHLLPSLKGWDPNDASQRKIDFISLIGFVPEDAEAEIKAALRSGDPRRVADAAVAIDALVQKNQVLERSFSAADLRLARGVRALRRSGFDAAAAAKRYEERRGGGLDELVGRRTLASDAMQSVRQLLRLPDNATLDVTIVQ